jgi:hypothetical protein
MIGLDPVNIPVQVTAHPVEGFGLQTNPEIATTSPLATGVHTIVTDPEVGFGVEVHTGAVGAIVSTVTVTVVAGDTFPAGSVAVTAKVFGPCGNGVTGVIVQVPDPFTIPVPITSPLAFLIVITSPGVPVPTNVGVVSGVIAVVPVVPATDVTVGATGAVTSSITDPDHAVSHTPITGAISIAQRAPVSRAQVAEHPSPLTKLLSSQYSHNSITPFPHPKFTFIVPVVVVQLPAASHDTTDTGLDPEVKGLTTAQL